MKGRLVLRLLHFSSDEKIRLATLIREAVGIDDDVVRKPYKSSYTRNTKILYRLEIIGEQNIATFHQNLWLAEPRLVQMGRDMFPYRFGLMTKKDYRISKNQ